MAVKILQQFQTVIFWFLFPRFQVLKVEEEHFNLATPVKYTGLHLIRRFSPREYH